MPGLLLPVTTEVREAYYKEVGVVMFTDYKFEDGTEIWTTKPRDEDETSPKVVAVKSPHSELLLPPDEQRFQTVVNSLLKIIRYQVD